MSRCVNCDEWPINCECEVHSKSWITNATICLGIIAFYGALIGGFYFWVQMEKEESAQAHLARNLKVIELRGGPSFAVCGEDQDLLKDRCEREDWLKKFLDEGKNSELYWEAYYKYLETHPDVLKRRIESGFLDGRDLPDTLK